jgi:microcin C transport system substrate-binding protein
MNTLITAIVAAGFLAAAQVTALAADDPPVAAAPAAETVEPVTLPADVIWATNEDDPLIGSPKAIRGGVLNVAIGAYPLTLRIMGPNSNDSFAAWNRAFSQSFTLVQRHPVTDKYIPMLATHWSIQKDEKTIYLKLDPDVRFSDGHPVTADDYVFTWKMMQSKFIVDPFYNTYAEQYYQSVDKIDDYTLRIVGTRPSWRPLSDYAGLWPTPAHATVLDKDWVTRTTNEPAIVVGPYVISDTERGQSVTFKQVPNWWGDKKR